MIFFIAGYPLVNRTLLKPLKPNQYFPIDRMYLGLTRDSDTTTEIPFSLYWIGACLLILWSWQVLSGSHRACISLISLSARREFSIVLPADMSSSKNQILTTVHSRFSSWFRANRFNPSSLLGAACSGQEEFHKNYLNSTPTHSGKMLPVNLY